MLKPLIYSLCLVTLCAFADSSKTAYFDYFKNYPHLFAPIGRVEEGEIEIILDEELISLIEEKTGRTVGVMAEDSYWLWVNDAVKFPNGSYGVYGRFLQKPGSPDGLS